MTLPGPDEVFFKCKKPDCMRKVMPGITYCCGICAVADDRGHEICEHSQHCEERLGSRGEFSALEASLRVQPVRQW